MIVAPSFVKQDLYTYNWTWGNGLGTTNGSSSIVQTISVTIFY
eukprot:SAG25_NODE_11015_length_316_cov_0.847926_1_plen_42_part_01